MRQCKCCGKKVFFLSVSEFGLCKICESIRVADIQQEEKAIKDCMKIIDESKNIKTRLSGCDMLMECANRLLKYEYKEIKTISPSPSQLLTEYTTMKNILMEEDILSTVHLG